jgi:hypothetical protein
MPQIAYMSHERPLSGRLSPKMSLPDAANDVIIIVVVGVGAVERAIVACERRR